MYDSTGYQYGSSYLALASYNHNVLHPSFIYERIDTAKKSEPPNIYEGKT